MGGVKRSGGHALTIKRATTANVNLMTTVVPRGSQVGCPFAVIPAAGACAVSGVAKINCTTKGTFDAKIHSPAREGAPVWAVIRHRIGRSAPVAKSRGGCVYARTSENHDDSGSNDEHIATKTIMDLAAAEED